MPEPDRVNITFGMKMPGPVEYSSVNFSVSLSSDVKGGETLNEAWERVSKEVDERATEYYEKYGKLQSEEED